MNKFMASFAFLVALVLASCSQSYTPPEPEQTGTIEIILPSAPSKSLSKGILSQPTAAANINSWGIYIFDPLISAAPKITSVSPPNTTATINLAVGTYSVLVTAQGPNYLLGAGETKNVAVTANNVTSTTVTVNPVDFSFSMATPPQVGSSSTMDINLIGNAGVANLEVSYFTWTIYDNTVPATPTVAGSGTWYPPTGFRGTPTSEYNTTSTISVGFPITANTNTISIVGYGLAMKEGSASFSISQPYFFGYNYCPTSLNSNYLVTFTPRAAVGIGITIGWGPSY